MSLQASLSGSRRSGLSRQSRVVAILVALVLFLSPLVTLASMMNSGPPAEVAVVEDAVMPCHAAAETDTENLEADCCDSFCANCGFCFPAAAIMVNEPVSRSGESMVIRRTSLSHHPFSGYPDIPYRPPTKTPV